MGTAAPPLIICITVQPRGLNQDQRPIVLGAVHLHSERQSLLQRTNPLNRQEGKKLAGGHTACQWRGDHARIYVHWQSRGMAGLDWQGAADQAGDAWVEVGSGCEKRNGKGCCR